MSKQPNSADAVEIPQDQTVPRSNTDNAPRSAIHQTLYSADTFAQHDYLAGKKLPDIVRPQEGQINWLHFVGINNAALLKHALDKVSFDWLIKNDAFFMEQLVKRFGYTQDFELLEWVIKKTHYDKNYPEDYGSLFWVKNCDSTIKLHSNTFKVLQKLYNVKTAYKILEDIKGYINYLGDEEQSKKEELTEEQRIKILANIAYFGEQYKYTDDSPYQMMGRLRYFLSDSQVDILVKNKYFNLPKFKKWWDKADYDEYYVTECEYEGSCGPGYHPLSEKEWRAQQKDE